MAEPLPGHEAAVGRLSIPYLTTSGVVALKFRCIDGHTHCDGHPKYIAEHGSEPRLYNTTSMSDSLETIVITEGELDALVVHRICGLPAVAAPGASSWQPMWDRAFVGYSKVVVLADGDEPGRQAAGRIAKGIDASSIIYLPDGTDANSIVADEGPDALLQRMGLTDD